MGLFSRTKKLSLRELDDLLREISSFYPRQRDYVRGVFLTYASSGGGISKREVEEAIRELQRESSDTLTHSQVEKVRDVLLAYFENE